MKLRLIDFASHARYKQVCWKREAKQHQLAAFVSQPQESRIWPSAPYFSRDQSSGKNGVYCELDKKSRESICYSMRVYLALSATSNNT